MQPPVWAPSAGHGSSDQFHLHFPRNIHMNIAGNTTGSSSPTSPSLRSPQGERRELKGARAIGSVVLGSARGQNGHPEVLPMALRALSAYQSGMRVPVPPRSAPAGRARRTRALEVAAPVVERAASVLLDLMRLLTVCTHAAHGDGRTSSRTHRCLSSTTCTST